MQEPLSTADLTLKIAAARAKRVRVAPRLYRGLLTRVFTNKSSPRVCIQVMCLECVGYAREEIRNCTAYACPLWNIRPYQADPVKNATLPAVQ